MYNHRNNTNSAWAFTLTLLMIFTALFGGFSSLGISGEVGEAYAVASDRYTTLDLTTGSGITINAIAAEGWAWDGTTTPMILTLNGINLSTASETGIKVPSGTSIVVTGTNTVESANTTAAASVYGIYSLGDLTITGDGTLTVTGGATTGSYKSSDGIYIHLDGDLTISGAGLTVNATGGSSESYSSFGISSKDFTISGGTVTATGGTAPGGTFQDISYGIFAPDSLSISGGTVTAIGGNGTNSYGIRGGYSTISGGTVTATGGVATDDSFGIFFVNSSTISGGIINAMGDTATDDSFGIEARAALTISGGTVTATGGNANDSRGIYSSSATTITGGEVNATGGTATSRSYGIDFYGSNFTMSNGTVTAIGGTATSYSYGIYSNYHNMEITSGVVNAMGANATNGSYGINVNGLTISEGTVTATAISGTAIQFETITLGTLVMITSPVGAGPDATNTFIATVSAGSIAATNVAIGAITEDTGSGGSGGSGGGSTPTTVINTNTGSVTENQLKNAAGAAKTGDTVTIQSNRTSEVTFPASGLGSLAGKDNSLTVVTENGTLTFDSKAVSAMGAQATAADIQVMVENVEKSSLTEDQQAKVGDKKVYDLTVLSGGKLISSFDGGKVNVSIPYELKAGETTEKITVWYMADDGSLTEITCTYDATTKSVTFVVDHFSKYIIGYDGLMGWMNPFHDLMNDAWYYQAVAYVNARDLMKGQTNTTFGLQVAMTRGMLVTILGRMEGIDTTVYATDSTFSDVDNNQYYAPYIAWASEKDIVNGMGEDRFAPDAAVTREQMAVMMTNYLTFKEQGPTGAWAILLTYGDLDKVSSWASEGVMFMTMKALMKGMGDDKMGNPLFAPNATSTRAQTAQVMMNLDELLQ